MLPSEAREIWVNTQLAASIEHDRAVSRAMNGWAFHIHESLLAGMRKAPELERLREQLRLGEYLVVAWLEGNATGVDFKRSEASVYARFAPQYTDGDLPDYRPFLPGCSVTRHTGICWAVVHLGSVFIIRGSDLGGPPRERRRATGEGYEALNTSSSELFARGLSWRWGGSEALRKP